MPVDVISDLREEGIDAYPMTFRAAVGEWRWDVKGQDIFSLSGIANARSISRNESGTYVIYPRDEQGLTILQDFGISIR